MRLVVHAVRRAIRDPVRTYLSLQARIVPDTLFDNYADRSREQGIDGLRFILSFDCDTPEDAEVVEEVHARVRKLGAEPAYAVAGELLEANPTPYQNIASDGASFLNHGYTQHTYLDESSGRYATCFFYRDLSRAEVAEDIRAGHRTLTETLGQVPSGFRTPHFGKFQRPQELTFIHKVAAGLGYTFSSSTGPLYGFRYGAAFDRFGLTEFPLTGGATDPLAVFDSWTHLGDSASEASASAYLEEAEAILSAYETAGAGILNLYVDPVHVAGHEPFFDAVKLIADRVEATTYEDIRRELP